MPFIISHQKLGCFGLDQPSCGIGIEAHRLLWGLGRGARPAQFRAVGTLSHTVFDGLRVGGLVISIKCFKTKIHLVLLGFGASYGPRMTAEARGSLEPVFRTIYSILVSFIASVSPMFAILGPDHR